MTLAETASLLEGASFRWWICGGKALELHAGESWRAHADTDVGVLRSELSHVYRRLSDWPMWVAGHGSLSSWTGRHLALSDDETTVWVARTAAASWAIDITISEGDVANWVYRRDSKIYAAWSVAIRHGAEGIPYLAPHLQLLFKAKTPRRQDHQDAEHIVPSLSHSERAFLRSNLPHTHPWQQLLSHLTQARAMASMMRGSILRI